MSEYVPDEVIAEIFARLPPKTLIRFRSLSKSWCSRIDNANFIHKHASLSPKKVLIKVNNRLQKHQLGITSMEDFDTLHPEYPLPFYANPRHWKLLPEDVTLLSGWYDFSGTCNGVLCILGVDTIILWNPSIRHKLVLPYNFNRGPSTIRRLFAYKFNRGRSNIRRLFGFGYDPVTHDYKIVMHIQWKHLLPESSLLYSINTGFCRPIAVPAMFTNVETDWGCSVNGVLHWIVEEKQTGRYIMTFDLSVEVFGMITLPEPSGTSKKLTTIKGSLAVISYDYDDDYSLIWVRKEHNNVSSWSMVPKFKGRIYEILQVANGNFLIQLLDNQFVVYNPVTGMQSRLIKSEESHLIEMETYVETLLLLGKGTACKEYQSSLPSSSSSSSPPRYDDFL